MPNVVVVGTQWGDEGKGKVVDVLSRHVDAVVRFQGGNNAGHTLVIDGAKVVLHLLPSGVMRPTCVCIIANGVVVDPSVLLGEHAALAAKGRLLTPDDLVVSPHAHVIMPYHLSLDRLRESSLGDRKIGTTCRGIGPCYEDKVARRGVWIADLLDEARLRARVTEVLPRKNREIVEWYGGEPLDADTIVREYTRHGAALRPFVRDGTAMLHRIVRRGGSILFEGAQGTFLDVDHGTYPHVTSSNTVAGAACAGSGIGPTAISEVVGIAKAYTTRVGAGVFPTEMAEPKATEIQRRGAEFGATTGRARRVGWFDAALVRHAVRINGVTRLALTKLDVLSGETEIPVCVGYEGVDDDDFPPSLDGVVPRYEVLPGWTGDLAGCRTLSELPATCLRYVKRLEELCGIPIELVSVGADREHTIRSGNLFTR
ncbi:MAG: adenylosuccinate synthase [Myxococcota bacterium]